MGEPLGYYSWGSCVKYRNDYGYYFYYIMTLIHYK